MSDERRQHPRLPVSLPVHVTWAGGDLDIHTGDISDGGAYLQCDPARLPELGDEIEVQAIKPLGDGEPAPVVKARIVRVTGDGVGVKFLL
jgi:hypothetical protein